MIASAVNYRAVQGLKGAAGEIRVNAAGYIENDISIPGILFRATDKEGEMVKAYP